MYLYSPGQEHYGLIEQIHIRGIFEDPTEAGNFVNSCGDPCFTQESNYPVATWMFESAIKPHILQQMVVKTQAPLDKDNNANDDTVPQPTPRLPMRQRTEAAPQQQKARRR